MSDNRSTLTAHEPQNMRSFFVIWLGELISIMGSGLTSFALGVWIFEKTGQATPFAMVVLFASLPRILLAPLAGSLADRWNRRWLMILADTGSALSSLWVIYLLMTGQLEVWHVYVLAVVSACFATFQEPAYTASVTMLVPKKDLPRASGMIQMGQSVETLFSPLLAGVLLGAIGMQGIFVIDFVSFFFAVGALLLVRIPQPKAVTDEPGKKTSLWSDTRIGWDYLKQRTGLFWLLWYFALVNFLLNVVTVLMGPLVLSFGNATTLGVVQTTLGAGMLLGSILISIWGGPKRRIHGIIGFITLSALGLMISGLQASALVIGVGMFILMFCLPFASAASQAVFQTKVSPGVQGRVFAIRGLISRSMMPVAFLLAGPLADAVFNPLLQPGGLLAQSVVGQILGVGPGRGVGLMFILSGLLLVVTSGIAFANLHIRNVEDELEDQSANEIAVQEPISPVEQPTESPLAG